ncbi:MAG: hypothetical protein ACYC25_03860 [Paludibacter sp.]
MKKSHIFILIYVLTFISCSSGKTIQRNENTNNISKHLFETFNDKNLTTNMFLDSLKTIEGKVVLSVYDCLNPYRKEVITDLFDKNLLKSDTIIFIETGGDCINLSGSIYTTYVYSSFDKEINLYYFKSTYNKENVFVDYKIVNEKVEKDEAIKAIIDNKFPDYLRIQKIEQKNNCASKYKYSMFTKLEQRYKFWHIQVTLGEHECIQ